MAKYLLKYNLFSMIWHVLQDDVHKLQYDPKTQYRYHVLMTRYWVANFPVVIVLFFFFPKFWIAIALFLNTIYSLYANLATDYGAVPASYAAMTSQEIAERQKRRENVRTSSTEPIKVSTAVNKLEPEMEGLQ